MHDMCCNGSLRMHIVYSVLGFISDSYINADSENKMFYRDLLLRCIVLFYSSFFSCAVHINCAIGKNLTIDAKSFLVPTYQ